MKEIYILSGLGADKRVYEFIDFTGYKVNHVEWMEPASNESIECYAQRLVNQLPTPKPILLGVSFGGIMCVEMGKLMETEKIILLSSAMTKSDIPIYYRMIGKLKLNRLVPSVLLKRVSFLTYWFFGVQTQREQDLLKMIVHETNDKFLQWAIDKIVNWKNEKQLENIITIHGSADRILPCKNSDHIILDGGHFMIVNRAKEVERIVRTVLD